jgi:hypothetical protein
MSVVAKHEDHRLAAQQQEGGYAAVGEEQLSFGLFCLNRPGCSCKFATWAPPPGSSARLRQIFHCDVEAAIKCADCGV